MRRVVVVGNGIAGLTAADTLRAAGFDGDLTIVGEERHAPYSRPALSKAALQEDGDMTAHLLPEPEHGAREILDTPVTGLDADRRILRLASGEDLDYDGLVVATGSRARRVGPAPEAGAATAELTLRGLDDAVELRRRIAGAPSVVVIGGGPLGMEVASGCAAAGCAVTLVSRRTPLTSQLGPWLAGLLTAEARAAGVDVRTSSGAAVDDHGHAATVRLDDGTALAADLVVSAVGDVPNTEWLAAAGAAGDGAVVVDSRGRLRPDIVAAGDVAAFPTARGIRRVPLWMSAIAQAKVAAVALLGGDAAPELDFQPYFWTEQFGVNLKACGELPVTGTPEVLDGDVAERRALLRWAHADGSGTAVSLNHRMPVPRLRALTRAAEHVA